MNMTKTKLSLLATLILAGSVIGQAQAVSTITSVQPANANILVGTSSVTVHTLKAAGASIAAGMLASAMTAATGHIEAGGADELSIKWDAGQCAVDVGSKDTCTVTGLTPGNTAIFQFAQLGGGALTAVAGATDWYGEATLAKGKFDYEVMLKSGQTLKADTYKVVVDAGVVTQ